MVFHIHWQLQLHLENDCAYTVYHQWSLMAEWCLDHFYWYFQLPMNQQVMYINQAKYVVNGYESIVSFRIQLLYDDLLTIVATMLILNAVCLVLPTSFYNTKPDVLQNCYCFVIFHAITFDIKVPLVPCGEIRGYCNGSYNRWMIVMVLRFLKLYNQQYSISIHALNRIWHQHSNIWGSGIFQSAWMVFVFCINKNSMSYF